MSIIERKLGVVEKAMNVEIEYNQKRSSSLPTCNLIKYCSSEKQLTVKILSLYHAMMHLKEAESFRCRVHWNSSEDEVYELRMMALAMLHAVLTFKKNKKTSGF